jgi:hypothetical protein
VREPHEAVPAEHRGEDQRVHDAVTPGRRVEDQAHATEVDLQLVTRLAVVDPHRRTPATCPAAHLGHVALHRAARDLDPAASQQLVDLHCGEIVFDPRCDRIVVGLTQPPRLTVAVEAVRAHRLDHQTDEPVGELLVAALADQTETDSGIHVAADGLAVEADQPFRRSDALAGQPQPQHLSNLEHSDLPERHCRLRLADQTTATATSARPTKVDPEWSHHWRWGGPMLLALSSPRWSHAAGGRHVPYRAALLGWLHVCGRRSQLAAGTVDGATGSCPASSVGSNVSTGRGRWRRPRHPGLTQVRAVPAVIRLVAPRSP